MEWKQIGSLRFPAADTADGKFAWVVVVDSLPENPDENVIYAVRKNA